MSKLLSAIPVLPTLNLAAAVAFYESRLGFRKMFVMDGHAGLRRDTVEIHLWQCADPNLPPLFSCRIEVEGIKKLYGELSEKQVIHPNGRLETKPWGYKEFVALDLDGNALHFAEDATGGLA